MPRAQALSARRAGSPRGAVAEGGAVAERPDAATINEVWEAIKATEKRRTSVFDGLPPTLPALLLADKVLDRLSRTPADPSVVAPRTVRSGDPAEDIGERLLALVAEARAAGVDPEQALRDVVRRLA